MNRELALQALQAGETWDILIIGGGASGLGAAVDAASRGFRTALLEAHDFAKGTSSRSTKLIHGGVRYLRQGNVSMVRDSLRERALLFRNAPELTRTQSFVTPAYSLLDRPFYGVGLKIYDALAGGENLGASRLLSHDEALQELPNIYAHGLRGGVRYYDGQFDDARLALSLASLVHELGGVAINYLPVVRFLKESGKVRGVVAQDVESGTEFSIRARVVINATGVFTDAIRRLDDANASPLVAPSQGAHIVVDRRFLPGSSALMVPKTRDGRVLFAIPWKGAVVIGTTDVPVAEPALEPRPLKHEIEFLLEHAALYMEKPPVDSDVLSAFAGLRPLIKGGAQHTAQLSRDHAIFTSENGLLSITGGKWTTYRKMAEDVVTRAAAMAELPERASQTKHLKIPAVPSCDVDQLSAEMVRRFTQEQMARTVEDVLARRTRALLLDARRAMNLAPMVAPALAEALGRDAAWVAAQVSAFEALAKGYLWSSSK